MENTGPPGDTYSEARDYQENRGVGGGWHRWGSVVNVWICWLLWGGVIKALGVMLPVLEPQFTADAWLIGWIVAITDGVIDLSGPFASPLGRHFGAGSVAIVSGLMLGSALIVASFASSVLQIAVVLTILAGPGMGLAMVLARERVACCFSTGFGLATAIGQTGSSCSLIAFAPLTQLFLNTYGWRGTMLLLGAISLHLAVGGALICKEPPGSKASTTGNEYRSLPTTEESSAGHREAGAPSPASDTPKPCCSCLGSFGWSVIKEFDLELLVDISYWMVAIILICETFAFEMWLIYYVSQAQAKGFSPEDAGYFVVAAGVANIFGHFASGICAATRVTVMMALFICLSSAPLLLTPFTSTYWEMVAAAFIYGGAIGATTTLAEVLTRESLGSDRIAGAFGWMGIKAGLLRLTLGFFPGWIFDSTGSYDISFVILGCIHFVTLPVVLTLPKLRSHHNS